MAREFDDEFRNARPYLGEYSQCPLLLFLWPQTDLHFFCFPLLQVYGLALYHDTRDSVLLWDVCISHLTILQRARQPMDEVWQ